jgi:serine/threonine protein kinase
MATKQRCPKCNELNDLDATMCARCRAPLRLLCPLCGTERPWYAERCPVCEGQAADAGLFPELYRDEPRRQLGDRYLLRETLARGQVSAVYRAVDTRAADAPDDDQTVAVKELSTVALFRPEERREAEASLRRAIDRWERVAHPARVAIRDLVRSGENFYVVFEFVYGWTLGQILRGQGRATPDLVRNWGAQLCDLLIALHGQNPSLHVPFLSPDHVMIEREGRVRLVGLGLGHLFRPNAPQPFGSTRGYAAPELKSGFPTVASDIFGLGRLLYAALIDHPLELGLQQAMPLRKAAPDISTTFARAIARAAHRDPARRFSSTADMLESLWDARALGPLTPLQDWQERLVFDAPPTPQRAPRRREAASSTPRAEQAETMADAGFSRDPRFGPRESTAAQPRPAAPEPEAQPALSVYPHHLHLPDLHPDETKRVTLTVRNSGEADLVGRVTSHVDWISAPKKTMRLPAKKQARVILSVQAARIPAERTVDAQGISVDTNAGRQWVAVTAELVSGPALCLEASELDFGQLNHDAPQTARLGVSNSGRQPLSGQVEARVPWLRVHGGDLSLKGGQRTEVRIELLPERLPNGPQAGEALLIDSDGGQARVMVRAWRLRPKLALDVQHLDFGAVAGGGEAEGVGQPTERILYIKNAGDGMLEGTVRSLLPWLQVQPSAFQCASGELVPLILHVDATGLADGAVEVPQALRVQTNGGSETLSLRMEVLAPRLVLETDALDFGAVPLGEVRDLPLVLRNEGSMPIVTTLQPLVGWLALSAQEVSLGPGEQSTIRVQLRPERFASGQHLAVDAALRLVAGSTVKQIPASITVLQPALQVEPERIDFGYVDPATPETRTLIIRNEGTGRLAWNLNADAEWLEWRPASAVCAAGESQEVTLTAYGLAIDPAKGSDDATLIVNSDGGRYKVPLHISLAAPLIAIDMPYLDLGVSVNLENVAGSFRIFNHGLGQLRGSIIADQTWIVPDRASFECATGRSVEVRVSTDMEELQYLAETGEGFRVTGLIRIESNSNDGAMIEIEVTVEVHLEARLELPPTVELLADNPEEPPTGRLILKNVGLAPVRAELRSPSPNLVLAREVLDIKPGKSVRVRVQWTAAPPGADDELYLELLRGDALLRIPVRVASASG